MLSFHKKWISLALPHNCRLAQMGWMTIHAVRESVDPVSSGWLQVNLSESLLV